MSSFRDPLASFRDIFGQTYFDDARTFHQSHNTHRRVVDVATHFDLNRSSRISTHTHTHTHTVSKSKLCALVIMFQNYLQKKKRHPTYVLDTHARSVVIELFYGILDRGALNQANSLHNEKADRQRDSSTRHSHSPLTWHDEIADV